MEGCVEVAWGHIIDDAVEHLLLQGTQHSVPPVALPVCLDSFVGETQLRALVIAPHIEAARLVDRFVHSADECDILRRVTLSNRVDSANTNVVNCVGLQIRQLVGSVGLVSFRFSLVKDVHLVDLFALRHVDVVKDDLFIVIAWLLPLDHNAVVEGLEDVDVLDWVRPVTEVFRVCLFHHLLVIADFLSFKFLLLFVLQGFLNFILCGISALKRVVDRHLSTLV
mmetsp:Transcript_11321/g.15233  ORF Transcript_11321/g.15233 Transcript_11321/m.15233 type:complete len:224 (-) Transcript_11321:1284-1955(-)